MIVITKLNTFGDLIKVAHLVSVGGESSSELLPSNTLPFLSAQTALLSVVGRQRELQLGF